MRKFTSIMAILLVVATMFSVVSCGSDEEAQNTRPPELDDNTVVDEDGVITFTGDYTWKDAVSTLATNWNPHTYENADDSYPLDFIVSGLYSFIFNDALNPVEGKDPYAGYKIIPEMAAKLPVDVTEDIKAKYPQFNIPADAKQGYAYVIDLNPDAKWQDGTPINADTYVYSMKQLLNPELINYRATDYYDGDLAIAGAKSYAFGGRTVKTINSVDGEAMVHAWNTLTKGADGVYVTVDGGKVYFGLKTGYKWMNGNSLSAYANAGYIPEEIWNGLTALADDEGFVPVTDESINLLYQFTGSDTWGNETKDQLGYYINYEKTYDKFAWENVGCLKTGEYQITLVLEKSLTGFYLLYNLSGNWLVYQPLYDANIKQVGDTYQSTYCTSKDTTMSYGPYKMVDYQTDKGMRFEKNENWYGWTDDVHIYQDPVDGKKYRMYQTTAIDCQVVAEAETRKMMFMKGELMGYGLQADDYASLRNSDYCYATPATSTFFLILNGHAQAIANRENAEDFNKATHDLECMTLTSFKQALALSYDRDLFASTVSPARSGALGLIGTSYIYDPDTGAKYRDTDQAKKALCDFYAVDVSKYKNLDEAVDSITGYDVEGARKYFAQAFKEAIDKGFITDTDKDGKSDQKIEIQYTLSSDSDFMTLTIGYLNSALAEVLKGTAFEGKIEFIKSPEYGNDWFDKLASGLSDTVLGGWSGSALNPFSLTDLYVNPDRAYDAGWFDATTVDLTIEIKGEKITMTMKQWSDALNGAAVTVGEKTYNFGDGQADIETRLAILAALETRILQTFNYIPVLQDGSMALLSQQVYYVIEDYNEILGRGGLAYTKYNFNDEEWKAFIKSSGGQLKY